MTLKRTKVAEYFKNQGCELLDEYTGCMKKMKYKCSCGNVSSISWNNFTKGKRCGKCCWNRLEKYTLEEVKEIYKERGCEFLEKEFKGTHHTYKYKCKCGRIAKKDFNAFHKQGQYCWECGRNQHSQRIQHSQYKLKRTTEEVAVYFENQGCELLGEYTGALNKMKYKCSCGNISFISWNNFTKGRRCGKCCGRRLEKYTIEEVKEIYKERGCEFLEKEFKGTHLKYKYRCKCGRVAEKNFNAFHKLKQYCWDCGIRTKERHHYWIPDREKKRENDLFRKRCYKALSSSLKAVGKKKVGRTSDMLGYTPKQLQEYVKTHPNWEKVKDGSWHLDHIFPINAFLEFNIEDIKIINSMDNLQPLLDVENISKSDKYNKRAFKEWLKSKNVIVD